MRKKREEISCTYITVMNSFYNTRMDKICFINWRLMLFINLHLAEMAL